MQPGGILYEASPRSNSEDASYPRVIRLGESSVLLSTFDRSGFGGPSEFPVFRSEDDGITWTTEPISVVRSWMDGWGLQAPTLFVLSSAQGAFATGTVLIAGTAWNRDRPDYSSQTIEIHRSDDGGMSWVPHAALESVRDVPDQPGYGIWEPTFAIDADGALVGFWSHERYLSPPHDYAQVILHRTSRDGGLTWSDPTLDVAVSDGDQRPGMPTVVQLADGSYLMAYEVCRASIDADHACAVYVKRSADCQVWEPTEPGALVTTRDGRHLLHTPYVAAMSNSDRGPSTVVMSGQRVVRGPDGCKVALPESGRVLFVNERDGVGPWTEMPAPFPIDPTGGYKPGEAACPNYSSPLLPSLNQASVLMLAGVKRTDTTCGIRFGAAPIETAVWGGRTPSSRPNGGG